MKDNWLIAGISKVEGFNSPVWDDFAGENGAYVARSSCSKVDAIAEPVENGHLCFLVRVQDGATIEQRFIS